MAGNVRFSGKQNLAIIQLLKGESIANTAKLAGVSERSLYRWLKDENFVHQLHQAEMQILEGTGWKLVSLAKLSVDALESVIRDPTQLGANNKRLASVSLLELLLKWREQLSFEERITKLEEKVLNGQGK